MLNGIEDAGRWSLIRRADVSRPDAAEKGEQLEHVARVLLRRWGVVFWKLLQREAAWLPPWRELRRVCQRLEARGEIRGGRFVDGIVGEQFALPEAVEVLRRVRKLAPDGGLVVVSAADPLNLVGDVLPGAKVPAVANSRIVYRDGLPIAARVAGEATLLQTLEPNDERAVRAALRQVVPRVVSAV
jgi:ATP-dependent Lhr-like helicase